jgi:hypothetical protein
VRFVEDTVTDRDLVGLRERVLETLGVRLRVNGRVVAIGLRVTVTELERVLVPEGERVRLPDVDRVGRRDAGIVNRGDRLGLTERVLVLDTVGVTLRVNGRVVAIGDLVTVTELERVRLVDRDRVTDTEVVFVARRDAGIVNRGDRLGLTERVLVLDTVGVTLRVNGRVVAIGDLVTVTELERVRLVDRDRVTDTEVVFVARRDAGILNGGDRLGLMERVLVPHTV